jgi:ATP-dependent protease HslVU (ClpYQ) peptidase subunit
MAQHGSIILVVINGVIYTVDGDYSWVSDPNGIYAIGTGAQYAMGAVHALQGKTKFNLFTAKKTVLKAMAAAAKFDPYTGAPYQSFVQEAEREASKVKQVSKSVTKKIGK